MSTNLLSHEFGILLTEGEELILEASFFVAVDNAPNVQRRILEEVQRVNGEKRSV